jgi:uncharacterized protein (DUF2141 family)
MVVFRKRNKQMKKLISVLFLLLLFNYSYSQESYSLALKVTDLRNSTGVVVFALYNKDGSIPDEKLKNVIKKNSLLLQGIQQR